MYTSGIIPFFAESLNESPSEKEGKISPHG